MQVAVEYYGRQPEGVHHRYDFSVSVLPNRVEVLRHVIAYVQDVTRVGWVAQEERLRKRDEEESRKSFDRAVALLAIQRIESLGRDLAGDADKQLVLEFQRGEIYAALQEPKTCEHQERRGRDLFCRAAKTSTAATSVPACARCKLPDSRFLCSRFMHVQVAMSDAPIPEPLLVGKICDAGEHSKIKDASKCVPGGHECWRRILDFAPAKQVEPVPPLALSEAFDHLSAVWCLKLGVAPLVNLSTCSSVAELSQPCSDRDGLKSRLSALGDVLKSLYVDDAWLSKKIPQDHTIARLENVLETNLPGRTVDAINALRAITELRNGFQHGGAANQQFEHAITLRLQWPPVDPAATWEQVRARAVEALREIRRALQSMP